jgi:hypothetical protein
VSASVDSGRDADRWERGVEHNGGGILKTSGQPGGRDERVHEDRLLRVMMDGWTVWRWEALD